MKISVEVEEGDRQMLLLALAELALSRPGFDCAIGQIADRFQGREMFAEFKRLNADRVKAERIPMLMGPMIVQNDDPELLEWMNNASLKAGGFLSSLAWAGLRADWQNYPIMRSLLLEMRKKYPEYEPTDAVKEEISGRVAVEGAKEKR
jgi:hypothetical protein